MGLYDAFKDALNLAQKADNLELYRQMLDLSAQALDLQEENSRLKNELLELKKQKDIESKIERHSTPYLTLSGDEKHIRYCATCWAKHDKLIQLFVYEDCDRVRWGQCFSCEKRFELV